MREVRKGILYPRLRPSFHSTAVDAGKGKAWQRGETERKILSARLNNACHYDTASYGTELRNQSHW
jgi:hypothetical protein